MFSVLMSLYYKESEANLKDCLMSLALQTLLPSETVIVYDGDIPQELHEVVSEFKDELKIKVIELKTNVGLGQALNYGLGYCNHELVARMDTDDICDSERFEKQISFMNKNEKIVLLGSNIVEFDGDSFTYKNLPQDDLEIKKFSKVKNPFNHMTVVFRKKIIRELGGYKHHLFMEDYNLWLRVISKGYEVRNLPDHLVKARVGNDMLNRRKGLNYIKSEVQLFKLKSTLKINKPIINFIIFFIRVVPRLMPVFILKYIYKLDRGGVK